MSLLCQEMEVSCFIFTAAVSRGQNGSPLGYYGPLILYPSHIC